MPIAPFRKFVSKRRQRDNMIPLKPARAPRFSFGNVAGIMNDISSLCILGTAIKGGLMATVNLLYQDSLRLAKRLHCAVAFSLGMNRFCHKADQEPY
jgi:hypothetical protein